MGDDSNNTRLWDEYVEKAKESMNKFLNQKVKIAIIGRSGAGKSSLINAIAGKKVCEVGSTEQTMEEQEYPHEGIIFVDLPGCGTEMYPQDQYISKFNLTKRFDLFILVLSTRVYKDDVYLYDELCVKGGLPVFIVRSKIDIDIDAEIENNDLTEDEAIVKIRKDLKSKIKLKEDSVSMFYVISTRKGKSRYDLPVLVQHCQDSQLDLKRDRLVADMSTWNKEAIKRKKIVALRIGTLAAVMAAANAGLNPIPGLGIAADIAILIRLCRSMYIMFSLDGLDNLSEKDIENIDKDVSKKFAMLKIKKSILDFTSKFLTDEGIKIILKKFGKNLLAKSVVSWIPFLGQMIAAGISYKMTKAFADELITESTEIAEEMLDIRAKYNI